MKKGNDWVPRLYIDDPSREQPPMPTSDFVQATEVITEYERGLRDGIARREALAVNVMEFTARVERHNINLDIENKWLKFQKRLWMFVSFCMLTALLVVLGR